MVGCRYCGEIEYNVYTLHSYRDSKGKTVYDNIHSHCKEKETLYGKKVIEKNTKKLKKCYFCGIQETDEAKVNKHGNHLLCSENSKKQKDKIYYNKSREKKGISFKKKTIVDRINETPEHKICTVCQIDKHISEFYQKRNMSYVGHCKKCQNDKTKKWVSKNKEKARYYHSIYIKKYQVDNKDKINKRNRERNKDRYKNDDDYRLKVNERSKKEYKKRKEKNNQTKN